MNEASDRETVERLGVLNGMSACQDAASFSHLIRATLEDLVDVLERKMLQGNANHVHRGDWKPPHCVDIRERVCGCDLPVGIGVVNNRSEEIQGLHQGELFAEPVDSGIVRGRSSYQEILIFDLGQPAQNLRKVGLAELGGSARTGRQFCQALDVFAGHGAILGKNPSGANMTGGIPDHF